MTGPSVAARPAPGRAFDPDTFTDLTDAAVTTVRWEPDGWLRVTFDRDLDDVESAAVRRRMQSANAADEQVRAAAEEFMNTRDPNRLQIAAQVKLLTRSYLGLDEDPPEPATLTDQPSI